jgi:hypothetical protein
MANFIVRPRSASGDASLPTEPEQVLIEGTSSSCHIYGKPHTYKVVRSGEDAVASIGYVSFGDERTHEQTLSHVLGAFKEESIAELKKTLVGQYILIIKKSNQLYIFSDFMGARNVFYALDKLVVSSSFSDIEKTIGAESGDLDLYKIYEYLAVRHVLYPAWLGSSTENTKIGYLRPYEYLVVNLDSPDIQKSSVVYSFENHKSSDLDSLSEDLLSTLGPLVSRPEFHDSPVACSLSGGRDSRLIATLAGTYYKKAMFRVTYEVGHLDSTKDMKIAAKLAQVQGVPLDIYKFIPSEQDSRFYELTEGVSPNFVQKMTPLFEGAGKYSLGLGGVFGTELFMPLRWESSDHYIRERIKNAQRFLHVSETFWAGFNEALHSEFSDIKNHYRLAEANDQDYIRLFGMLNTGRFASFIMAAFNSSGYQLEPYGSYVALELALRVSPLLWGNHRTLQGDASVQKGAMAKLHPKSARILTYKNRRPMVLLAPRTLPIYAAGIALQAGDFIKRRFHLKDDFSSRTPLPDGYLLSNGWERNFIRRSKAKYGLDA